MDIIDEKKANGYLETRYSNGTLVTRKLSAETAINDSPQELTEIQQMMQAMADSELRDFAIQQGQELLAQQMADIELAVLGGAV